MSSSGLQGTFAQQTDVIKYSTPVKVEKNNGTAFLVTKKYFDGLERPVQSIDVGASAQNGRDVVSFVVYDNMGRGDAITYLPYVATSGTNNGEKIANPLVQQQAFYQNLLPSTDPDRNYAYAQKQYDNSPLSLVLKEGGVGAGKNMTVGNPTNHQYRQNSASEVKNFSVSSNGQLIYRGYYAANTLAVRRVYTNGTSEEDSDAYEYVNSLGQTIASEVRVSGTDRRMTYYVYDDFGRKRYVIPPIQEKLITTVGSSYNFDAIKKYSYYTEYDGRGNPIREWAPGGVCTSNVFDLHGRLVLSQNPEMAKTNLWIFSKYDTQDRPVISGTTTIAGTAETVASALQTYMAAAYSDRSYETRGAALHGYTNKCYPTNVTQSQVLNATYYDDYAWVTNQSVYGFSVADAIAGTAKTANSVAGMTTGTKTKVLGAVGDQWLTSVTYYDNDYNPIQTISDLYPSGIEIVSNKHNFAGQVVQTKVKQVVDGVAYEYNKWLDYDAYGRLLKVRQKITGDPQNEVVLAEYTYDDLGRTVSKKIHGGKEETTFAYDIANRNTGTTSPSFSYKIGYDKSIISGVAGRRDGLISQITWSNNATGEQKAYAYAYDKTKQYLSASFYEKSGATWTANAKYKETIGSYDTGGNIQSLQRSNGSGAALHNYTYTYGHPSNGYALTKISGSADFLYDANGNMTRDGATGVQIDYNILELPEKVYKGSDQITYIYAANGQKLAAQTGSSLTYYRSVMVYSQNGTAAQQLSYMIHPEGLAVREGPAWVYKYFKTDHLGNTRALLAARNNTLVNEGQNTDYYPLGYAHSMANLHLNKYLYSGKEYQDAALGGTTLGLYDFGARFYNPSYGRWFNLDPKRQFANQYAYCGNNPLSFVDPDGRDIVYFDRKGHMQFIPFESEDRLIYVNWEWNEKTRSFLGSLDGSGVIASSDPFPYHTIKKQGTYGAYDINGNKLGNYDVYKIRGDANGTKIFEFLSYYTMVEWSLAKTGIAGDDALNFLTTSHEEATDYGMTPLYRTQLFDRYTLRKMIHNHPSGTAYPSGSFDRKDQYGNVTARTGEWGDVHFSRIVTNGQGINHWGVPEFEIYLKPDETHEKRYIKYGPNSLRNQY